MTASTEIVAAAPGIDAAVDGAALPDIARFFRRWLAWTTLGEGVGFTVAAVTGVIVATTDLSGAEAVPLLLAAGAVESALLGAGQVLALRGLPLPRSLLRRWPLVTSLAAVAAWALGLLPSTLPGPDWSSPWVWVVTGLLGLVLLGTIPIAQLWLLRSALHRSWRWLPANGIGWLVGISWTLAVSPLVDTTTPALQLVVLYAAAGMLMALTVAVTTGICWIGWLRHGDLMADGLRPTGQRSLWLRPLVSRHERVP